MKFNDYTAEEILKEELCFNKAQFRLFKVLLKANKPVDMDYLTKKIDRERTSILKMINFFIEIGIVDFEQKNLHRGFKYFYFLSDNDNYLSKTKSKVIKRLKSLEKEVDKW